VRVACVSAAVGSCALKAVLLAVLLLLAFFFLFVFFLLLLEDAAAGEPAHDRDTSFPISVNAL
jgi:hypothetical protein